MKNGFCFTEFFIVLAIIGLLAGIIIPSVIRCQNVKIAVEKEDPSIVPPSARHQIVVIDGCQYIESINRTYRMDIYTICHKGNCTNKVHFVGANLENKWK